MDKENLIGSIVFVVALASYIAFNYWRTEAHVSGRVSIDGAAYAAETCTGFQSGVTILLAGNMRLRATRTSAHQSLLEYNGVRQDCSQLHLRVQPGQIVSRIIDTPGRRDRS